MNVVSLSSRKPIQLLDSVTINQIAAGEVIENSVSVVKELVENALDAGADTIEIETLGGGQGLIVVKDNGCGMDSHDVSMALQRHATSKIDSFSDVFSLMSFGFRGEALPAIASIARLEILSSTGSGERSCGMRFVVHDGKVVHEEPCARQRGTTITVEHLFYNVPVRRGFQKSPLKDRLQLRKVLENRVLSTTGVEWTWISERQKELFVSKEDDFAARTKLVMGEDFMQDAIPLQATFGELHVSGFLGSPHHHRPNRQGQRIFVNERPVESSFIARKVGEAYSFLLPPQRYPMFVLKVHVPAQWCDFNVHPQKLEVRLLKEDEIGEFLFSAILDVLARPQGTGETVQSQSALRFFTPHDGLSCTPSERPSFPVPLVYEEKISFPDAYEVVPQQVTPSEQQVDWCQATNVRWLASLGKKVILAEDHEGVHLVFTQSARKQLFYAAMSESHSYPSQSFLIPLRLSVTAQEGAFFAAHKEALSQLGIEISQVGPHNFAIDSAPAFLEEQELIPWLHALAAGDKTNIQCVLKERIKKTLSKVAFHASKPFETHWLALLWGLGKPEIAIDGTRIRRLLSETDLLRFQD